MDKPFKRTPSDLSLLAKVGDILTYLYARPGENAIRLETTGRLMTLHSGPDGMAELVMHQPMTLSSAIRDFETERLNWAQWLCVIDQLSHQPASDYPDTFPCRMDEIRAIAAEVRVRNANVEGWHDYTDSVASWDAKPVPTTVVTQANMDTLAACRDVLAKAVGEYVSRKDPAAASLRQAAMARLDQADEYTHKLYAAGHGVPTSVMDAFLEFAATVRKIYGI